MAGKAGDKDLWFASSGEKNKDRLGGGMNRWKVLTAMLLTATLVVGLGCGQKPLQVVSGCETEEVMSTENGKLVLTYEFNKELDRSSVVNSGTFFVTVNGGQDIDGIITFPNDKTVKFTSIKPVTEIIPSGQGVIKVRLAGSSRFGEWIADLEGKPLDGDCDGSGGGDFVTEYPYKM